MYFNYQLPCFAFFSVLMSQVWSRAITSSLEIDRRAYGKPFSPGYGTVMTTTNGSIMRAVMNNPPINLYDYKLAADLYSLVSSLENNTDIKIVILSSANPDFWIAHYDLRLHNPVHPPPPPTNATTVDLSILSTRTKLATLPIIFIAEIDGRATGLGNEIAVQCDMRFAGPQLKLSQFEVGFGLIPGAGGIQFLSTLIGRARAFEYILSGRTVNAATAEAIGWINTAYPSKHQLHEGVTSLAQRIAAFPRPALAAIKARINAKKPSDADLKIDNDIFYELFPTALNAANRYLELSADQSGNQFELDLTKGLEELQQ